MTDPISFDIITTSILYFCTQAIGSSANKINACKAGCYLNDLCINHVLRDLYADNMFLFISTNCKCHVSFIKCKL